MSFDFGVGDFIAVSELCSKLYQNVCEVSQDAPEELRGIRDELRALSDTIRLLNDDIQDPGRVLQNPEQERNLDGVVDIMRKVNDILLEVQSLAKRYGLLHVPDTRAASRQDIKIQWDSSILSKEWNSVTDLRAKILSCNKSLSLLLQVLNRYVWWNIEAPQPKDEITSPGSLHREEQNAQILAGSKTIIAPGLDTKSIESLTQAFLKNAQSGERPWDSFEVDDWLKAGRWWLLKAQSQRYRADFLETPQYNQTLVDLLKSSWILTNVIQIHPHLRLAVSSRHQYQIIDGMTQVLKAENDKLAGLTISEPSLEHLMATDLSIWCSPTAIEEYMQKLQRWLSAPDPSTNYRRALQRRQDGTALWFFESEEFSQWTSSMDSRLWLSGVPGCGKTVLSSAIIQKLEMDPSHTVLYFFFDFSDAEKRSLEGMLRSLINQLYRARESTRTSLDLLFSMCQEDPREQPSIEALCDTLTHMIQQTDEVYIVIDALDECETQSNAEHQDILSWVKGLNSALGSSRVLLTSRNKQNLRAALEDWVHAGHSLHKTREFAAADIRKYVSARLRDDKSFAQFRVMPNLREQIETDLMRKAQGVFLWVCLSLESLSEIREYGALQKALKSLPPTLDETYKRALEGIQPADRNLTLKVLQWVVFSARPLRLEEIVDAVAITTEDELRRDPSYQMLSPGRIQQVCSPLIEIGPSHTIKLAHTSVREYLTSGRLDNEIQPYFTEAVARAQIAKVCLQYLLRLPDKDGPPHSIRNSFPLAYYAARYWMSHAAASEELDEEVSMLSMRLLLSSRALKIAYRLYSPDRPWRNIQTGPILEDTPTALYCASFGGLSRTARLLLDVGEDVNILSGEFGSALHAAAYRGHLEIVKILLESGANVDMMNTTRYSPLQLATMQSHIETVRLLLDYGATPPKHKSTPLAKYSNVTATKKEYVRSEAESHYRHTEASTLPDSEFASTRSDQVADAHEFHSQTTAKQELGTLSETNITSKRTDDETALGLGEYLTDATSLSISAGKGVASVPSDEDNETYYSGGSGVSTSEINEFIVGFANELLKRLKPGNPDQRSRVRVKKVLPDLLKAFALKLGQNAEDKMHRHIMVFTHKYRGEIAAYFEESFGPKKEQVQDVQNQTSEAISPEIRGERTSNWLETIAATVQDDPLSPSSFEDDENQVHKTDIHHESFLNEQGDIAGEDEEDSLPNHSAYREHILKTPAYQWLLAELKKEMLLEPEGCGAVHAIRHTIASSLPLSRIVSANRPIEIFQLTFVIPWDLKAFLDEQRFLEYPREAATINQLMDPSKVIEKAVTITGSAKDAQALTTEQYLRQTWPTTGKWILKVVRDVVALGHGLRVSYTMPDRTRLTGWMKHSKFFVQACGTGLSLAELGEQLAWLSTALRSSPYRDGIASCTPFIHDFRPDADQANAIRSFSCRIGFNSSKLLQAPIPTEGQCWHNMFRNPVLVEGFPIPRRPCSNTGLEIPLNVMAALADTDYVTEFNGKPFIKGFSTMLVPTVMASDILVWHLIYAKDRERISYWNVTVPHIAVGKAEMKRQRHVVGWCSEAKLLAGTKDANYSLEAAGLPRPSRGCVLDRATISGGYKVTAALSFALGQAHKPARIELSGYPDYVRWAHRTFVVFWDEKDKRGWLINGTTALLHIVRAILEQKISEGPASIIKVKPEDIFEASDGNQFTPDAAREVLLNRFNWVLPVQLDAVDIDEKIVQEDGGRSKKVTEEKEIYTRFQSIVQKACELLIQMVDQQNPAGRDGYRMKCRPWNHIEGWDFDSFLNPTQSYPSALQFDSMGVGWVNFIRDIGAVTIFAKGFGEIIRPTNTDGFCSSWKNLPKEQYFLAAFCSDLIEAAKSVKLPESYLDKLRNTVNFSELCSYGYTSHAGQPTLLPQFSLRPEECAMLPHRSTVSIKSQGAMIFSHNNIIPTKSRSKTPGSGILEDAGSSDASEPPFDDSALDSSHVRSSRTDTPSKSSQEHEQLPIEMSTTEHSPIPNLMVGKTTELEQVHIEESQTIFMQDIPSGIREQGPQDEQNLPTQPPQRTPRDQPSPRETSTAAAARTRASPENSTSSNRSQKGGKHRARKLLHKLFKKE